MLNIIEYELKRAIKSKSTYIILAAIIILLTLPIFTEFYLIKNADSINEINMAGANDPGEIKVEIDNKSANANNHEDKTSKKELELERDKIIKKNFSLQSIFDNLSTSGPMSIFFILFVAIAASKDYSSGYIKNLMCVKNYRIYQPIAKIIVSVIFSIVAFIITILLYAIVAKILSGNISLDINKTVKFISAVLVGQLAMTALVILLANYTNNQTATIVVSMLLILGIFITIISLIDGLNVLPIKLIKYSLFNTYGGFFTGLPDADFTDKMKDILKISIPMIFIYLGLNFLVLKNKDINLG